jgi:hypothetical protein
MKLNTKQLKLKTKHQNTGQDQLLGIVSLQASILIRSTGNPSKLLKKTAKMEIILNVDPKEDFDSVDEEENFRVWKKIWMKRIKRLEILAVQMKGNSRRSCRECGLGHPGSQCPCGLVFYCDEICQRSNWCHHAKHCSHAEGGVNAVE